ncbi:SPOR domain-containing protein [Novosphingobium sp. 1949]|uniref:SPOR domain-containing protein n=1 Tax=Novosphingobium organovorum TaxID=2930092 RepID=A0ABT0B8J2_9SPHN|nr:SPOR domain-containing protein [Novosphingobium organovorum]MCJ2181400.1 SPOR domain-containing protein [Novosphingobium organovorum]
MKLPVRPALGLITALVLISNSAPGALARERAKDEPALPRTGPAADYPVVIGDPFTIDGTVWTPLDQMNYDAVGLASVGDASLVGVTGASKTLPLPSYVEVTNLDTGRTALVRIERRGPMVNSLLIELSPMAARQLGISGAKGAAVRVRRVNPPEPERALLRQDKEAPLRMDTPPGLLQVLRSKLAEQSPLLPPPSTPPIPPQVTEQMIEQLDHTAPKPAATPLPKPQSKPQAQAKTPVAPIPAPASAPLAPSPRMEAVTVHKGAAPLAPVPAPAVKPAAQPAPKSAGPGLKNGFVVQVGAFSVEPNARELAAKLGGFVAHPGKFWLVRIGPFADRAKAAAALEKAQRAGYRDARIQHTD